MAGWTNRGKKKLLEAFFDNGQTFNLTLVVGSPSVNADTDSFGELTEIASGNGYSAGGVALTANTTDFTTLTEDDVANRAWLRIRSLSWTASGGSIPASGGDIAFAVLRDASNNIICYWRLGNLNAAVGTTITLDRLDIRADES